MKVVTLAHAFGADRIFSKLSDDKEFAFEVIDVLAIRGSADEYLMNGWLGMPRYVADNLAVDRDASPAEKPLAFFFDRPFDMGHASVPFCRFSRQKDETTGIRTFRGQLNPDSFSNFCGKGMGNLHQDARTVSCGAITCHSPPVGQIEEDIQSTGNNVVGFSSLQVTNQTDTAGIMFIGRVIKPFWLSVWMKWSVVVC